MQEKLPEWLKHSEDYTPVKTGGAFIEKSIASIGGVMTKIKLQNGHEKGRSLPALLKLFLAFGLIAFLSLTHEKMWILGVVSVIQLYLCMWPARDIATILKASLWATLLAFLLFLPPMIMNPSGICNDLQVILKVFTSLEIVSIFNHTTQWNHITGALRKLHIPGVFIFTLDITVKYIILLGNLIVDLLTAMRLRAVGKNRKEYQSIGGVMGVTFIRSTEMSREMYDAMRCRGFTDDYKGL